MVPGVAGSNPVFHPKSKSFSEKRSFFCGTNRSLLQDLVTQKKTFRLCLKLLYALAGFQFGMHEYLRVNPLRKSKGASRFSDTKKDVQALPEAFICFGRFSIWDARVFASESFEEI